MTLISLTICVLAIARGNGTLFDAHSLQEENIVELCVEVGQAHNKGVLWLLVMELVIAFGFSEEMLGTVHLVTKAMIWHDEPIKLHTNPRAYVAGRNAPPQVPGL